MKENKSYNLIITFFLVTLMFSVNIVLIYKNTKLKNKNKITSSLVKNKESYIKYLQNTFSEFISNHDNKVSFIDNVLLKDQKFQLVFWFSETTCKDCYEFVFKQIHNVFNNEDYNNILIVTDFQYNRSLQVFKNQYKLSNYAFVNIYPKTLKFDTEKNPCFFILNPLNKVEFVFFPDRKYPNAAFNYLLNIKKKYFKN